MEKVVVKEACWKEHTCVGCRTKYQYELVQSASVRSHDLAHAEQLARIDVEKALKETTKYFPCPQCGYYQPDMIAHRRGTWHAKISQSAAILLGGALMVALIELASANVVGQVAAVIAAVLVACHLAIDTWRPNKDLEANRRRGTSAVHEGKLIVTEPRAEAPSHAPVWPATFKQQFFRAALVIIVGVIALPELVRVAAGWPLNRGWYPPVIGVGDEALMRFPNRIVTVRGYWRGTPRVEVKNAAELGLENPILSASGDKKDWSKIVEITDQEIHHADIWALIQMPSRADLAGKTLELEAQMRIEYPVWRRGAIDERGKELHRTRRVSLASAGAGATYRRLWWTCVPIASALIVLFGLLLRAEARAFSAHALPAELYEDDATP